MKGKILLIDDEPGVIEAVKSNLEEAGFDVETASNGANGLDKARTICPDLILLDATFPEMNGLKVCNLLQGDSKTAGIPIIMLTAGASEIDRIVALKLGAKDCVTKSFSPRELLLRVTAQVLEVKEALFNRIMEGGLVRVRL